MERECQFMVPPPPHRYDESELLHRLMMDVDGDHDPAAGGAGRGGGAGERKRRFTEEQVRSLETAFHARRAKLEPREKAELARELGLQPRQVAIWFQNKRAWWRSKQLEQDYAALREQYDALRGRVESLKQEKLALAEQVDVLRGRLNERQDQSDSWDVNGTGSEVDDKQMNSVSCQDDGAMAPLVDAAASEDSAVARYHDGYVAYESVPLPDLFWGATPELWDTWPLLEWNAVA